MATQCRSWTWTRSRRWNHTSRGTTGIRRSLRNRKKSADQERRVLCKMASGKPNRRHRAQRRLGRRGARRSWYSKLNLLGLRRVEAPRPITCMRSIRQRRAKRGCAQPAKKGPDRIKGVAEAAPSCRGVTGASAGTSFIAKPRGPA